VSDATLSAPVAENPLRVVVDGERCRTNVRLPPEGGGDVGVPPSADERARFSRASPTLDATIEAEAGRVRVAATTAPASDGLSFTFRRGDPDAWTLARLVDGGTITPAAAGLLSVAVKRGVTGLVAGGRGAGKTTALGSLPLGAASRDAIDIDRGYAGAAGRRGDCGRARHPAAPSG